MATLEKHTKNKTKKSKIKVAAGHNIEEACENKSENCVVSKEIPTTAVTAEVTNATNYSIDNINDLVASTSATRDNIVTKECFIASDYKDDKYTQLGKEASYSIEMKPDAKAQQEDDNTNIPSAPLRLVDNKPTTPSSSSNLIQYPQIQHFQYEETAPAVVYSPIKLRTSAFRLSASKLQPLTQEQLYQYYYCADLTVVQQFEMEFLMNSLLETYENEPLYAALQEYYHLQSKLTMNLHDVKKFRKEAGAAQEHIWVEVPITKTFSEKCGDKIDVKESVTFNIIQVDGKNLEAATSALTVLFDIISNTYTSNLITTKIIKIKIDQMIDELIYYPSKDFDEPLKLHSNIDGNLLAIIAQLRRSLDILFHFSRKLSPNKVHNSSENNRDRK